MAPMPMAVVEWIVEPPRVLGFIEWDPAQAVMSQAEARAGVAAGFEKVFGRGPTLREAQMAQAVACAETGYGNWARVCAKHGPDLCCGGVGSFNMGSIQTRLPPCSPTNSFECVDHKADGSPYNVCFRKYASAAEGFAGLIKILYSRRPKVLAAASAGGIRDVAAAMRETTYYVTTVDAYTAGLTRCLKAITTALGEPMPPETVVTMPVRKRSVVLPLALGAVAVGVAYAVFRAS